MDSPPSSVSTYLHLLFTVCLKSSRVMRHVIQLHTDNYLPSFNWLPRGPSAPRPLGLKSHYPVAHLGSAGRCTSGLPLRCRRTAARWPPPPDTLGHASAIRRRTTSSSRSTDPKDSTGRWLEQKDAGSDTDTLRCIT